MEDKRNVPTIAIVLSTEYKMATGLSINSVKEYEEVIRVLQRVAADRETWKDLVESIVQKPSDNKADKREKQAVRRKERNGTENIRTYRRDLKHHMHHNACK